MVPVGAVADRLEADAKSVAAFCRIGSVVGFAAT